MSLITATKAIADSPLRGFHWYLVAFALLSPFADGYLISVLGVGIEPITEQFQLNSVWQGLLGAAALGGIFIGSLVGGWAADHFGRRAVFRIDLLVLLLVSLAMLWVNDPFWLTVLRLLAGVSTGASYPIASLMITETVPAKYRGTTISLITIAWFFGAMTAYLAGGWLVDLGPEGWRVAFACAAIPAIAAIVGRWRCRESNMWLARQGREVEALRAVRAQYGEEYALAGLETGVREKAGLGAIVRHGYLGKLVFVAVFWGCSLVPLNIVFAFGPLLLDELGLGPETASNAVLVINVLLFVGCVLWSLIMNTAKRRSVVIWSFALSGLALAVLGSVPGLPVWAVIALLAGFALAICGSQILQPLYPNEIFPTAFRGSAMGLASATARVFAVIGIFFAPQILNSYGIAATLLTAAGISVIGALISVKWAPETLLPRTVHAAPPNAS